MSVTLAEIVDFLDTELRITDIADAPNAVNGLQVQASERVELIACAVDADLYTVEQACALGADLLLVHHGLMWAGNKPLVGARARKLKHCFASGLSVYSAHLPLDVHASWGNNAQLVRALGLENDGPWGLLQGVQVGLVARCDCSAAELHQRVRALLPQARVLGAGPSHVRRMGVVTGGAGRLVTQAADEGLDGLLTGEATHDAALEAEERGVHLVLGGHYRTEMLGVRALADALVARFGVRSAFIEHDTGL